MLQFTLACPLIGIAQGAVNAFDARIRIRVFPFTDQSMIDLTTDATAETAVEVECARLLMRYDLAELIDRARRGDTLSMLDRARFRRDHACIAKLSVQAVSRVFEVSGGMAFTTTSLCWSASAAACTSLVSGSAFGLFGFINRSCTAA